MNLTNLNIHIYLHYILMISLIFHFDEAPFFRFVATKTPPEALASAMAPGHATPPEYQFSWGYSGDILC